MIHQGSGGFRGNTPDVLIQVKELETLIQRLHEILAHHTGQQVDKVIRDTERDYFMSPDQAKDYGIIDAVFSGRGESLIALAKGEGALAGEGSAVDQGESVEPAEPEPVRRGRSDT